MLSPERAPPPFTNHPLSQHHPSDRATIRSLCSQHRKSSDALSKMKVTVVTRSVEKYNGFQFPWLRETHKAMQEPVRRAASCSSSLHHRCQIEAVLTHDILAWDQAARLPFRACGGRAPSIYPPKTLPDSCEASKQHEDPALLRDLE
jgi:hypothetical protein